MVEWSDGVQARVHVAIVTKLRNRRIFQVFMEIKIWNVYRRPPEEFKLRIPTRHLQRTSRCVLWTYLHADYRRLVHSILTANHFDIEGQRRGGECHIDQRLGHERQEKLAICFPVAFRFSSLQIHQTAREFH